MSHHLRLAATLALLSALLWSAMVIRAQSSNRISLPLIASPKPAVVDVARSRFVEIPAGTFLVGELENRTGAPAYNVKVAVNYTVGTGATGTANGAALLPMIPAGGRIPFEVDFSQIGVVSLYDFAVTWDATIATVPQPLTVYNAAVGLNAAQRTIVEFRVRNDGPASVRPFGVAITFHDAAGQLLDVTNGQSPDLLAVGQEGQYGVEMTYRVPEVVSVIVQAQGIPVAPPPTPTPRPGPPTCDDAYPTVCIQSPPPDLNCSQIPYRNFRVLPPDPHNFDSDNDGIGCESG